MSWKKVKLGELYTAYNGLSKNKKFFGTGDPFLTFSTVFNNYFLPRKLTEYVQSTIQEQQNYSICRGDVFITRTSEKSDELGLSCVALKDYPKATYNGFTKRLRPINPDCVVPEYIGYYMRMPAFRQEFQAFSTMTTRASLRNDDLLGLTVLLPNIKTQGRIAGILRHYDFLIENNQKQIKLLEEAAQRLYKEWFVDLRFPGHENVEIVDGVPEGWHYKKISSFGSVITGKTPSTAKSQYYGGEVPFIKIPDMHKGIFPLVTEITLSLEGANSQKNKFIPKNSIIVSCIATVGLVNISVEDCQTNQQINSIVLADERSLYYLYFAMKDLKSLLDGVGSNGATMTNVNKEKFSNLLISCPDTLLLEKYYKYSKPLFDKILNLSKNINYLTEARNRLLPKLMSGEIEV